MKMEEDVPTTMPNITAQPKPLIASPPINANGAIDSSTVSDVATVRLSV